MSGPGAESRADDGLGEWLPIEQYAALGDGRTVALVGRDGRIDWWPTPSLNAPPLFAGILDPERGGCFTLSPVGPAEVQRRYLADSNVLETVVKTDGGAARITEALTMGVGGSLPWAELVRRVEGLSGSVQMSWMVRPGNRFSTAQPWFECRNDDVLLHAGDQTGVLRCYDAGEPQMEAAEARGEFTTTEGSDSLLALVVSDDEPLLLPGRADLTGRLESTVEWWRRWATSMHYDGPWREEVRRAGFALKLLIADRTGAIAAAGTTSLPERIGGEKNYDYRFMWVRDTAFTIDALLRLGLYEEAQSAISCLLRSVRSTLPGLDVFYTLDGVPPDPQRELDLVGYRHSTPVRSGNDAAHQIQLGTFGDLFDSLWQFVDGGHHLDPGTQRLLAELADTCCDQWREPDAGIWELHTTRQYTISKMGCWVALDRAVKLHECEQIPSEHPQRWVAERDAVHDWVLQNCWSEEKNSFTFYAGSDELDAATLICGLTGFDRGDRLAGTVAAVERELSEGPLVWRYTGMREEEGAFVACSFWRVSALAALGRHDEAVDLMDRCVALANEVGLYAEQLDADGRTMLGNFPQGLSHLALVNAALAVQRFAHGRG